jgi:sulfate transport system permease protein
MKSDLADKASAPGGTYMTKNTTQSRLPGFSLTLGTTILYLSLIVLVPLVALVIKSSGLGWQEFREAAFSDRAMASYKLTFGTAAAAAIINTILGLVVAWTMVRTTFPGRRLLDAMIDLPFALPTAVSGIALTAIYSQNGWIGQYLEPLGIKIAFTPIGITLALVFVGLPFVVRTVQPAIADLEKDTEEAAASLGASRWQTMVRVIFPSLLPATLTGFALALARGVGEYGSVVFISGNMPMKTEVSSLLIITRLEQYDYAGAAAIAVVMLAVSFAMLLGINALGRLASLHSLRGA